jgi:hypothetical protein
VHARRRRLIIRAIGATALVMIVVASVSDVTVTRFWDRNAMLTGILADILVLVLGVAVVNEWLDIRAAERWRTVAYYALVELLYASRDTWVRLYHALDVHEGRKATVEEMQERVLARDGPSMLERRAAAVLADPVRRRRLVELVDELSLETRDAMTNWAPVMITTGPSADAINRFTRMHARLMRLHFVLQETIEGHEIPHIELGDDAWAARRVATIIRLGAQLVLHYREEAFQLASPEEWADDPAVFEDFARA